MKILKIRILPLLLSSICLNSCNFPRKEVLLSEPIKIPNLYLESFSKENNDAFINYLTRSSEWHVFPINRTIVAIKRRSGNTCHPLTIFDVPLPSSYASRQIPYPHENFFNLHSNISDPSNETVLKTKANENSIVSLKIEKESGKYLPSHLVVESKDKTLSLNVFEGSNDVTRSDTSNYLMDINHELERLINTAPNTNQDIDSSILPPGSIRYSSHQTILIKSVGKGPGEYIISGYINPGQKGSVYLKVIVKKDGEAMLSDPEGINAEYTGWSSNPKQKFNFCLGALLSATEKDGPRVLSEFQLWFRPSNGSAERMLNTQTLLVDVAIR